MKTSVSHCKKFAYAITLTHSEDESILITSGFVMVDPGTVE
jgi:hypothetical protein